MLKGKKAAIFGMDGTLIDSVGVWNSVDEILISKIRKDGKNDMPEVQMLRDEALRKYSDTKDPYKEYCRDLKELFLSDLTVDEIYGIRYDISNEYLKDTVDYKKGADIFIRKLKEKGYILAIASTTKRNNINVYKTLNRKIMDKAPLDEYFSLIYTREDAKEIKPHPEIYLKTVKDLGLCAEECIVFEDSLVGVEAAKAAGLDTVAVYDRYSEDDTEKIKMLADEWTDSYAEFMKKEGI